MIYRILRAVHRAYALTVFWLYLLLFGVAFMLIFVFPPGTLLLLFVGIFGLVFSVVGAQLLAGSEHLFARFSLRRESCPICREADVIQRELASDEPDGSIYRCRACGAGFHVWGGEVDPDGSPELRPS